MSITTPKFGLELPSLGSYFGEWNGPINANSTLIDSALQSLKQNSIQLEQTDIVDEGVTWYDVASKSLFLHNGTILKRVVTSDEFIIELVDQERLINGQSIDLHFHPGYSTSFFRVKSPALATGAELTDKDHYAVPYKLFNDVITAIEQVATNTASSLSGQIDKLSGISSNGLDVTINSGEVSGSLGATSFIARGTNSTLTMTGNEITISAEAPVNIKTAVADKKIDLKVNGDKVWNAGNQGDGSGMDSDSVDGCDVDDTTTSTTSLWTSQKVASMLASGVNGVSEVEKAHLLGNEGGTFHDAAYFATAQSVTDHKTSSDHDERYVRPIQLFNVPIGCTIMIDPVVIPDWATYFDGSWVGLDNGPMHGFKINTGTNGTTNLIDKFVLGGGPAATFPTTGGSQRVVLESPQLPEHEHFFQGDDQLVYGGQGVMPQITADEVTAAHLLGHDRIEATFNYDAESRGGGGMGYKTMEFQRRGESHDNMPPYVAMIHITRFK